ncbi:tetratricopeptide repeat protein [Rhodohalobacter sp.]|uniref:type IX secretion system periplasmic lipoprotein PorW/SprE n=1 Tax=Rhodohalobacter sp. TaxID=1974210 RepID=UPI002ACDBE26|nr:tetratricopeptide repeat protein [Rhodohalobacter sp.]MDZ7755519.1 tetratricopeptide repeat protein [Rhodohalobacter sp.]
MFKHLYIILFAILLTGCVSPIKQGWQNFTAYYNTFYNAKQAFDEGLELNQRQQLDINPDQPIRIHPSPTEAGREEFERAIEKGASILRDHAESKYLTRAVSLIGQSYFYRQEYFSALEKFQELRSLTEGKELQEATIWQSRTYMELELYEEGINFTQQEIDFIDNWDTALLAELNIVLAQLYSQRGDWIEASRVLQDYTGLLKSNRLKARAYFLHGQVHERLGNNFQALAAYRLSSSIISEYDIEFNSKRKLAQMYRDTGDYQSALQLFRSLERDDKFINYHVDLRYEIATTYQQMNEVQEAVSRYNRLLRDRFDAPSSVIKAKSYFGLAEIHRDQFNDFQTAAAYFDSANTQSVNLSDIYNDVNAEEIVRAFGEYASLKNEIGRVDSLLHLSTLNEAELDSVIRRIRDQQMDRAEVNRQQNVFTATNIDESPDDATEVLEFGFLNSNDPVRKAEAQSYFRAVWGNRPLEDNWRRQSALTISSIEEEPEMGNNPSETTVASNGGNGLIETAASAGIDLSEIPFSEEEKNRMRRSKEQFKYRLGNLFFLSLNMPDSARYYFNEVIHSSANQELIPRAIYSLAELEVSENNSEEMVEQANLLFDQYPESIFADRIAVRLGIDYELEETGRTDQFEIAYASIQQNIADTSYAEKADSLVELAESISDEKRKSLIYLEAAENYLKAAQDLPSETSVVFYNSALELLSQIMEMEQTDTRVRRRSSLMLESVEELLADLKEEQENEEEDEVMIERFPEDRYPTDPAGELPLCEDVEAQLNLAGGTSRIIAEMNWSDEQKSQLPDIISYRFAVNPDGSVESFSILSSDVPAEFENALNAVIEDLSFDPVGGDHSIRCKLNFPIRF